jgi:hypothetical protein
MSSVDIQIQNADQAELQALLDEIGERNTVRVTKHAAVRLGPRGQHIYRRVFDEISAARLTAAALLRLDELRIANGARPRYLAELTRLCGGDLISVTANLRTTAGIDYVADSLGKTASRPSVAEYIAVTESATAPAVGDTTLAGEITTNGLQRALATYAHSAGATTYTMAKTFTAAGAFTAVQKAGLFNAAAAGTLFVENTFTPTALSSGDQLTLTWSLSI